MLIICELGRENNEKLFKSIILSAALLTGAAVAPSASAAWSGWQNESGYSRVFTDAATYTGGASTVDWKAEKKDQGHFITQPAYTSAAAAG